MDIESFFLDNESKLELTHTKTEELNNTLTDMQTDIAAYLLATFDIFGVNKVLRLIFCKSNTSLLPLLI